MKIKLLGTLGLASLLFVSACGGGSNTNANNSNANANANKTTATPVAMTNEAAKTDPNLKKKIEDALVAKGFKDVTVDVSTTPATLSGSVPKGKMAEAVQVAQEANGGKPVKSGLTEK